MKTLLKITLLIAIIICSCSENTSRIDYIGYSIGQPYDSTWNIEYDDGESYYKVLTNKYDTNMVAKAFYDTIWGFRTILEGDKQARDFIDKANRELGNYDSTYFEPTVDYMFEGYVLKWNDPAFNDFVELSRSKHMKREDFHWQLIIRNEKIEKF